MNARQSADLYARRVNRVIDHVRDHLADPLPLDDLARLAHFSPFHFHRIFRAYTGEPVHTFVRRLRLEKAVFLMAHGPRATLTSVALRCGFASSSDFSRAFKQAYGFSPRGYSRERLLEESKIRQDLPANREYGFRKTGAGNPDRFRVRLVDRAAPPVVYVRVIGGYDPRRVLAGYDRLTAWGRRRGLLPGAQLIGMSQDDPEVTPANKYRFDWCLVTQPGVTLDGEVTAGTIPANRFAEVRCRGDIHKEVRAWQYLFRTWLPASGYQPTYDPATEVYRRDPAADGWAAFDMDCCLPVKPLRGR
jgi:AraC family transcriptional regulator